MVSSGEQFGPYGRYRLNFCPRCGRELEDRQKECVPFNTGEVDEAARDTSSIYDCLGCGLDLRRVKHKPKPAKDDQQE